MMDSRRMGGSLLLLLALFTFGYCQNAPVIVTSEAEVREDRKIGELAFTIEANDPDGDALTYRIENDDKGHFDVSLHTGEVYIRSPLDREAEPGFDVKIIVSDGVNTAEKDVSIVVGDANDNAPIFLNTQYSHTLRENTTVGTTLLRVSASDADDGLAGTVTYRIQAVVPDEGSMFSITDRGGDIVLNEPLSYTDKSRVYRLKINASDGGGPLFDDPNYVQSTTATVSISVIDVPDHDPQFLNLPSNTSVKENSPLGTSVYKVQARDPDTGVNDIIYYSIEDTNAPDLFQISQTDGTVTIKSPIDREALLHINAVVKLTVKATEANINVDGIYASTSSTLEITIEDENDNKPVFYECDGDVCAESNSFSSDIDEHSSIGLAVRGLNMRVKDKDQEGNTENSHFLLHLEGPDKDAFSISPTSGISDSAVLIQITDPNAVDYEKKTTMLVQVIAEDPSTADSVSAMVEITVNDINDQTPQFLREYEFSINENKDLELTVEARDDDKPNTPNSKIQYAIVDGAHSTNFTIDPDTGQLKSHGVLDREAIDLELNGVIRLNITATDMGTPPLSSWTMAVINVDDINDSPPVFPGNVIMEVEENINPPKEIGQIIGSDVDTNHSLTYDLVSMDCYCNSTWALCEEDWFILEPSGSVKTSPDYTIDYEKCTEVEMKARVVDLYTEEGRNSTEGVVTIKILDVNDNAPEFIPLEDFFAVVPEDIKQNSSVASVYAQDKDSGENKKMTFKVEAVEFVSYTSGEKPESIDLIFYADANVEVDELQNYKAVIRSHQSLNPKSRGKYIVNVVAINGELSTATTIELFTVYETSIVGLLFDLPEDEIRQDLDVIKGALSGATKAMVHIVKVSTVTIGGRTMALVEAYFLYPDGTTLDSASVEKILNSTEVQEEFGEILQKYRFRAVALPPLPPPPSPPPPQKDNITDIIIGVVVPAVLILGVAGSAPFLRRKLKATKPKHTSPNIEMKDKKDEADSTKRATPVLNQNQNKDTMPVMPRKRSLPDLHTNFTP